MKTLFSWLDLKLTVRSFFASIVPRTLELNDRNSRNPNILLFIVQSLIKWYGSRSWFRFNHENFCCCFQKHLTFYNCRGKYPFSLATWCRNIFIFFKKEKRGFTVQNENCCTIYISEVIIIVKNKNNFSSNVRILSVDW